MAPRPLAISGGQDLTQLVFAAFLVEAGIDTISLNPDSVIDVIEKIAEVER